MRRTLWGGNNSLPFFPVLPTPLVPRNTRPLSHTACHAPHPQPHATHLCFCRPPRGPAAAATAILHQRICRLCTLSQQQSAGAPVLLSASPWISSSGFLILSAWVKGLIVWYVSAACMKQTARRG